MKRRVLRGSRYYLSKRYNAILLVVYVAFLCMAVFNSSHFVYKKDLMIFFAIFLILLTMLRLFGVTKQVRGLDIIITCAFGLMLLGCHLNVEDIAGFLVVVFIASLTMTTGGVWAVFSGLVTLYPCVLQVCEKWQFQSGYWFETMLGFSMFMMLVFTMMPDSDASELTFLVFSFLTKNMIIAFIMLDRT